MHVDLLVPMSDLWAKYTWVSLTGKTEKGVGRSGCPNPYLKWEK